MSRKLRVGVVFGGRSGEHEVSLVSATSVLNALDRSRYEVIPIGITTDGKWISSAVALPLLKEKAGVETQPERFLVPEPQRQALISADGGHPDTQTLDVVFPVLHGTYGEDGAIQGLLELADIPYVGAGVLGSALGMDKIVQKQLFERAKLPVAHYAWAGSMECVSSPGRVAARMEKILRYPMFVKPANTGSSVGITKAHNRRELIEGLTVASGFDRKVIIEQGVNNIREVECAVLGNDKPEVSVPGEIVPSNEFYDYDAKYVDGKSTAVIPAKLPKNVVRSLQRIAASAFTVLDCSGMARVDFFVSRGTHRITLNEINTIPGFTSISMYPKLWEASGLPYPALLDRLIQLALARHREKSVLQRTFRPGKDWYRQ